MTMTHDEADVREDFQQGRFHPVVERGLQQPALDRFAGPTTTVERVAKVLELRHHAAATASSDTP
jgi:hypothetical protein